MTRRPGKADSGRSRGIRGLVLAGALAAALVACSPIIRHHGYIPPEAELAGLAIGADTRDSVIAAVGAPASTGMLDDSTFYYTGSTFRQIGALAPQEISREVLAMSFDSRGVLTNIERFGLEQGRVVALSRRVTDNGVRDTTFLRQLLGNIGRVDAGRLIGDGD
ncbi:MAG: outer membrane protein assembly factor BamE [Rubellimicrobium sp.]|nr:outer membrane protein assembly factor BamE [Rubellimicrobium sp.]